MYILLGKSLDLWMKNGYFSLKKKKDTRVVGKSESIVINTTS
jgi:hypothetical protein